MKLSALVLSALIVPALVPRQEGAPPKQEPKKKPESAVTSFFREQVEKLTKDVEGSWTLLDYMDPQESPDEGAASGFASFHDGFLSLLITIDTYETRLFRAQDFVLINTGAYRYRFDEQGLLQLASVMSVTNQTPDGDLQHEPSMQVYEYTATVKDGLLELRNSDGVTITFRRISAKDFPDSAIRKLESMRGGQARWDKSDENQPR